MAHALTWRDVPRDLATSLLSPPFSSDEDESVIRRCLGVEEAAATLPLPLSHTQTTSTSSADDGTSTLDAQSLISLRESVLITMYAQFVSLARSLDFSERKLSTLLSIIRTVHESNQPSTSCSTNPSPPTIHTNYSLFSSLLVQHAVERPPYSSGIFSPSDVNAITSFTLASYYNHFKLYQHAFAFIGEMHIHSSSPIQQLQLEQPPPPFTAPAPPPSSSSSSSPPLSSSSQYNEKVIKDMPNFSTSTIRLDNYNDHLDDNDNDNDNGSGDANSSEKIPISKRGAKGGLNEAMTEKQKQKYDEEQRIKKEEERIKLEEEKKKVEDETLARVVAEEYTAAKVETIEEHVSKALSFSLSTMEKEMNAKFSKREEELKQRIMNLEQEVAKNNK